MKISNTNQFTDLYSEVKQKQTDKGYKDDKHLRFDDQNKTKGLYFHTKTSRKGIFDTFGTYSARRARKQANAGQHVWQSIANQYGEDVANSIFKNVLKYEGGDHRASITMRDLDKIKQALPLEKAKLEAIRLATSQPVDIEDFMKHYEENLDLYSSDEFAETKSAKTYPEYYRFMQAMGYWNRTNSFSHSDKNFAAFLKSVGINSSDVPSDVVSTYLQEERMAWMADKMFETFFPENAKIQLNIRGDFRREFVKEYRNSKLTAEKKMNLLRKKFIDISSQDGLSIVKGLAIGISEMQKIPNPSQVVDKEIVFEGDIAAPQREKALRQNECSIHNKSVVRNLFKDPLTFDKTVEQAGSFPQFITKSDRQYIAARLRGLAELEAQSEVKVDEEWAKKQIEVMIKELEGPDETLGSGLPQLQREAEAAADQLLQGLLNTRSMSLPDLNAKVLQLQEKSARLTHTRRPNFGPEDVQYDQKLLLARAAKRLQDLSHLDPMANLPALLRTAYFAMADSRTDEFNFFDNSRSSTIAPQMMEYVNILRFAVDQVRLRTGKPDLRGEFEQQRSLAEQAVSKWKGAPQVPGVPPKVVQQTIDTIVQRGLEAVERRERQERFSEIERPDENDN